MNNSTDKFDIETYYPLIKSIVNKYRDLGVPEEDLIQEGYFGVIEAWDHFDETKNVKFTTYAVFWIKKRILAAVGQEIKIKEKTSSAPELLSNQVADKSAEKDFQKRQILIPEHFPAKEKSILNLLYNEEYTLNEISKKMKLPRERVRQLKEKALRRLRSIYSEPDKLD